VSRWAALALGAWVAAFATLAVAYANRNECGIGIEGAYFNRSEGAPSFAGVFDNPCDEITISNPHLWLGAAIAFALVGAATLLMLLVRRRA
jgi:hypothetical protein